jgi:hypothetical protein
MRLKKDIAGQKYGKLTGVAPTGKSSNGSAIWLCRCDCGKEVEVRANRLAYRDIISYGCAVTYETFFLRSPLDFSNPLVILLNYGTIVPFLPRYGSRR